MLEEAANGVSLNAGQAGLVRGMCLSGRRVQLAIAPAGSGKTTAMRALTNAWTQAGGTVVGLAPSAAAAAVLGEQTGTRTDTLAKLTWSLHHHDLPDWATRIGPATLVVIDEAGMADTLSLDQVVGFVVGRGGSVRLVGDDQQLAAVGAGGVLRDIQAHPRRPPPRRAAPVHRPGRGGGRRSRSATAGRRRSASTSTTAASTSATSPPSPTRSSTPGRPTRPTGWTR